MSDEELLEAIKQEEAELQFESFTNETALRLGQSIVERAKADRLPVTVRIRRGAQLLFHCACEGTSADNDDWVERKARVVERFGRSTYYMEVSQRLSGKPFAEQYLLDPTLYVPWNGGFPIVARGFGPIGSVAVSGLPGDGDHALIVAALRDILGKPAVPAKNLDPSN